MFLLGLLSFLLKNICFFNYVGMIIATENMREQTKVEVPISSVQYIVENLYGDLEICMPPYYCDIKNEEENTEIIMYDDYNIQKEVNEKLCNNDASIYKEIAILKNHSVLRTCRQFLKISESLFKNIPVLYNGKNITNLQDLHDKNIDIPNLTDNIINLIEEMVPLLTNNNDVACIRIYDSLIDLSKKYKMYFLNNVKIQEENSANSKPKHISIYTKFGLDSNYIDSYKFININSLRRFYFIQKENDLIFSEPILEANSKIKNLELNVDLKLSREITETKLQCYINLSLLQDFISQFLFKLYEIHTYIEQLYPHPIYSKNMFISIFDKFEKVINDDKHMPFLYAMKCYNLEKEFLLSIHNLKTIFSSDIVNVSNHLFIKRMEFFNAMLRLEVCFSDFELIKLVETDSNVKNQYDEIIIQKNNLIYNILSDITHECVFNKNIYITIEDLSNAIHSVQLKMKTKERLNSIDFSFVAKIYQKKITNFIKDQNNILGLAVDSFKKGK